MQCQVFKEKCNGECNISMTAIDPGNSSVNSTIDKNGKRDVFAKMSVRGKLAWSGAIVLIVFALVTMVRGVPLEIVYTGDACPCPAPVGYTISVPKVVLPKRYLPLAFNYKVEAPPPPAAQLHYSLDFTVQEPRLPRLPPPSRLNAYAKVDRITMPKPDCVPPALGLPCPCGQCAAAALPALPAYPPVIPPPLYRYVYKTDKPSPCKCGKSHCKCKPKSSPYYFLISHLKTNNVYDPEYPSEDSDSNELRSERDNNSIRRKRDLHRVLFRTRKSPKLERPQRYVKLYRKGLPEPTEKPPVLEWSNFMNPLKPEMSGNTAKKPLFPLLQLRKKRDITGEYDMLEKERAAMDLTLPDIVQYMPETLRRDFKRGPCSFGCNQRELQNSDNVQVPTDEVEEPQGTEGLSYETDQSHSSANAMSYRKRNVAIYDPYLDSFESLKSRTNCRHPSRSDAALYARDLIASFPPQGSYDTDRFEEYNTNPYGPPPVSGSSYMLAGPPPPPQTSQTSQSQSYLSSLLAAGIFPKIIENDGKLRLMIADPTGVDGQPLHYAGNIENPISDCRGPFGCAVAADNTDRDPVLGSAPPPSKSYPGQHLSNEELDRLIADIVLRHPEFIDATDHYDGQLIEPVPVQVEETKKLIWKLLKHRFDVWMGKGTNEQIPYVPLPPPTAIEYGPPSYSSQRAPQPLPPYVDYITR